MNNQAFIRRTFELARLGYGTTWPNPLVGAVIVKNGKVIAEGFHLKKGEAHAELNAINKATESLAGSTMYVNLEPCCHTNKTTPPCAQRIITEKIAKVVICNLDPNPAVNGKGVELLRTHGIEVEHGILKDEGEKLNEVFFTSQRFKRPFIHFKAASTLDGKIAMPDGESQWITGEDARAEVHRLRSLHQAVITSGETVRRDNPRLTIRTPGYNGEQPWRIIISKRKDFDQKLHVFSDELKERTLLFSDIDEAMSELFKKNIINCFMEAGPTLASEFMRRSLVDRITLFQNPSFIGHGKSIFDELGLNRLNSRPQLTQVESRWIGNDHMITGRITCSQV